MRFYLIELLDGLMQNIPIVKIVNTIMLSVYLHIMKNRFIED
ncbi:unnamed protein product [Paramecium octaurelia]|uniref:Uncharacterized protein n=1 Tax=Paramecium octaurelia TaxID=43137 RepID=A0A8S1T1U4_PAROT|nr:unnamed protein product [Paramecium octaurelia]